MRVPRKLWDFIDSENETPLWWGQPNAIPEVQRMVAPLSKFLYVLAILAFGWAFWKIISALLIFSATQMVGFISISGVFCNRRHFSVAAMVFFK